MPGPGDGGQPTPSGAVGPTVARERLRARLRELREHSGLSTDVVAKRMDWSPSKLSRIEKGDVTIQPLEVRALLAFYKLDDDAEVTALTGLARQSRTRQWYSKHRLNGDYQRFVAYEHEASTINIWQVLFIPGLLQTPGYARALTALTLRSRPDDPNIETRVELRLDRQQAFRERIAGPNPPRLVVVIDESTLRRPVGGYRVMVEQLDHLMEVARQPAYSIGITPVDLLQHPGLSGTFELLQFPGADPDVLFVEAAAGTDDLVVDPAMTALYGDVMADLLAVAHTGDAALEVIHSVRDDLDRRSAAAGADRR
ncbi:helix-turn-helix transcriptional regulator [Actinoplanes sp. N902-109]|uniref:helix-turn-helix domain-containing protein n=1 Tax=Actinoplanes sp. (strain N902-109) TaxID=649831 RepID=UPI0003AAC88A|nr:helix-turn-helix transcriptional regulator [Actinoplanes sp. N902-109]